MFFTRRNIGLSILVVAALALYLSFLSRTFDEGDAFNFALGLIRYDIAAHQPHPPGYPVFMFIASIPYLFTNNPLFSLSLVSAVSGAITLIPNYVVAKRLFNQETAFFSSLALVVVPGFWLISEQALSDILAIFFLMLAFSQLLLGSMTNSRVYLYTSWATLGLAMGVRPFNFIFIVPFVFETVRISRRLRDLIGCGSMLILLFCLSFIPAILLTGIDQYATAMFSQLNNHLRDDVHPFGLSAFQRLILLLLTLAKEFGASLPIRVVPVYLYQSSSALSNLNFALILIFSGASLILLKRARNFSKVMFMILWVAPYFAFVYSLGSPGYPRYMLPIVPPILIVMTASALQLGRSLVAVFGMSKASFGNVRFAVRYLLVILFIGGMFVYSLPLATTIHTQLPPTVQLVEFVRSNYDPTTTTVLVFHELRAFQFFGSEFRYVHCCHNSLKALAVLKNNLLLSGSTLITGSALVAIQKLGVTVSILKVAEFNWSPLVKSEDSEASLFRITALK